jgi:prepilin-type N-terminal cleavage/methylation domain-containing protein
MNMTRRRTELRRSRRAGFTLLELMVALAIGALVVATMYTLSGAASRTFQAQQRVSQLQMQTRLAMERLRRDITATGAGGTPDSFQERPCGAIGITRQLLGVQLVDHDPTATAALATMPGGPQASTHGDRLTLLGNFSTSDSYMIGNLGSANGSSIILQSNWQAFRRSFTSDPLGTVVDTSLFSEVFAPGRVIHVTHPNGYHFFTVVNSASVDSAGRTPTINVTPPLPGQAAGQCNFALCIGCQVSPLSMIEYGIDTAQNIAPALVPTDAAVVGTNTVLYRRELDPSTGNPLANVAPRVVLEFAIDFEVTAIYDTAVRGNPPVLSTPQVTIPAGRNSRVRALQVQLAGRTPATDPSYPWPLAGVRNPAPVSMGGDPLTAFRVFTDRPGASRVRVSMAEFVLENLVMRGM